jgi:hypothetical protein
MNQSPGYRGIPELLKVLLLSAAITVLGMTEVCAQMPRAGQYRLELTANPSQVPADNSTEARVRIEVRETTGRLVAGEVQLVVSTSLGYLSEDRVARHKSLQIRTNGGVGIVFVSSDAAGLATITAWVGEARNSTTIRFLPEGEAARPVSKVIHVRAKWVGFSVDHRVIEARDEAQIQLGKLSIAATDSVSVDLTGFYIQAASLEPDGVVVQSESHELAGNHLYFDLGTRRGCLRRLGDGGVERVFFDAYKLTPVEDGFELPPSAFRREERETQTWLLADGLSYFIGEKIVLRHGSAWVGNQKIVSFLPIWIIGLPGYRGSTNSNMFSLSSDGGLALDFPYFYSVTETTTGAVKVQHGTEAGSIASRDGWALAWEREYRALDDDYEGSIEIAGLPRSEWGWQWQDQRRIRDDVSSYLNVAMPDHHSIFSDVSAYRYASSGRYNLRAYYDNPRDYIDSYGLVGDWLANPIRLDTHKSYRLGLTAGVEHSFLTNRVEFNNDLFASLDFGTHALGSRTTAQPRIRNVFSWDTGGYNANAVRFDIDLKHSFGRSCLIGMGYGAEYFSGDATVDGIEQTVTLDLMTRRGKWYLYLYGSHNITFEDTFAYLDINFYPSPKWRWEVAGTYYDFDGDTFNEWELTVARIFGQREIGLSYSEETNRISLELGGFTAF